MKLITLNFLVAFFLLFPNHHSAVSGTLEGIISSVGTWKYPKVRHNSSKELFTMYWDASGSSLRFVKWDGSSWQDYTSVSTADLTAVAGLGGRDILFYPNEYRANFDFDSLNNLHVIFSAGTSSLVSSHDAIHGIYDGSSWGFFLIEDDVNGPQQISLHISSNNKIHIAYTVDGHPAGRNHILNYATNQSGSWVANEILETGDRGIDELHDTYIVADSSGTVTLLYRRENNQNNGFDNYYEAHSTDYTTFSIPVLVLDGITESRKYRVGNMVLGNLDKPCFVYSDLTNSTAHFASKVSDVWGKEQLVSSAGILSAALDIQFTGLGLFVLTKSSSGYLYRIKKNYALWEDGSSLLLPGTFSDRFDVLEDPLRYMLVSEKSSSWTAHYYNNISPAESFSWPIFIPAIVSPKN